MIIMTPSMRALRLPHPGQLLHLEVVPLPEPGPGQLRLQVCGCAVCRTDLHIVDGELHGSACP